MPVPYWFKSGSPKVQSQIGWNPASGGTSNVLTLLPAGHAPGIYAIHMVTVIRTGATGSNPTTTVTWNSPTFGAESRPHGATWTWSVTGTVVQGTAGITNTSMRTMDIMSNGTAPITMQWSAGTISAGSPVIDIYACAQLVGL